ncbi:hypothetical protein HK097_005906 [Rhizophlyctis rosea]|uniref:Peptidase S54 rhomboid domain-containing protein n=1 Tax=Rhizophlyctis rosea TaxID=64517 RepID=A0AAD5SF79_9FUNG|nr:hypothetical protein HK097_005906 [Rhizophlyctis rosea]
MEINRDAKALHAEGGQPHRDSTLTIINCYSTPHHTTTPGHTPTAAEPPSTVHTSYYERQVASEQKRDSLSSSTNLTTVEEANVSDEPEKKPKKVHRPWFIWIMTLVQTTGSNFNYFIGPANGILIHMGARYAPCMRNMTSYFISHYNTTTLICPPEIPIAVPNAQNICTLADLCGFPGTIDAGVTPNQWWRFIMPLVLHAGLLHYAMNMMFQMRQGVEIERDWGWWRTGAIYMISGVGGFIFGGNFSPMNPSVGCSGSIYGLVACLLLDLLQNLRLVKRPLLEVFKMLLIILISFLIGTLPNVDNMAHIGGFFCGLIAGLIFVPTVHFSTWDGRAKRFFFLLAIPGVILLYVFLVKGFYEGDVGSKCEFCKYLNCIPGMPWCEAKWAQMA